MTNVIENLLVNSYNEKVRNVRRVRNMNNNRNFPLSAKLTSKGQITIPKEVREKLGIKEGDTVGFYSYDGLYLFGDIGSLIDKELNDTAKMIGFDSTQDMCNWIKTEVRPETIREYNKKHK